MNPHLPHEDRPIVHVVDDDLQILRLFERLSDDQPWQVRTWSDGQRFLDEVDLRSDDPLETGVLVLDLRMPGVSGLDILQRIVDAESPMPVIFMSEAAAVSDAMTAVKKGILDFIEKPFTIDAMRQLIAHAIEEGIRKREHSQALHALQKHYASLTKREREVMDEVVAGNPNKVIGANLGISAKTVEVHRAKVMSKMRASSVADLVRMAMRLRGEVSTASPPPNPRHG